MSTMQQVTRALLAETDPDARFALGRQLAGMVLRLLNPTDEPDPEPEPTDETVYDDDAVPF
jgi:hypothetical protein